MICGHGAKVLPSVPKCKKAGVCLAKKIYVLGKVSSSMTYDAVG